MKTITITILISPKSLTNTGKLSLSAMENYAKLASGSQSKRQVLSQSSWCGNNLGGIQKCSAFWFRLLPRKVASGQEYSPPAEPVFTRVTAQGKKCSGWIAPQQNDGLFWWRTFTNFSQSKTANFTADAHWLVSP